MSKRMEEKYPEGDVVVVEYVVGSKQVARIRFLSEKQFSLAEQVRREYIKTVPKPTWTGFMKYMGVIGVRVEHDKPDRVVGFLDLK